MKSTKNKAAIDFLFKCTVAICTRNRAPLLLQTLEGLAILKYDKSLLDILIVDNGSTDNTKAIVESVTKKINFQVSYVFEDGPGLSYARNRAIREAKGDILLFIDDDIKPLASTWAIKITEPFKDQDVAVVAGDIIPSWPEGKRPEWLHPVLASPLASKTNFDFEEETRIYFPNYPFGANFSLRKNIVSETGGFLTSLGWSHSGNTIAGEETELFYRIEQKKKKIVYVPDAGVHHYISASRIEIENIYKRARVQGKSDALFNIIHFSNFRLMSSITKSTIHIFADILMHLLYRLFQKKKMIVFYKYFYLYHQNYLSCFASALIKKKITLKD